MPSKSNPHPKRLEYKNSPTWVETAKVHILAALGHLAKNDVPAAAEILADVLGHLKFHHGQPAPGLTRSTKMGNLIMGGGWSLEQTRPGGSHVPPMAKAAPAPVRDGATVPPAAPPEPLQTFSAPRAADAPPKRENAPTCPACGPIGRVFRVGPDGWACGNCGEVIEAPAADVAAREPGERVTVEGNEYAG